MLGKPSRPGACSSACALASLLACGDSGSSTDVAIAPVARVDAGVSADAGPMTVPSGPADAAQVREPEAAVVMLPAPDAATGTGCGDGTREDVDGDGFTAKEGDCNDCLRTVNPAAFDVPGNQIDEDCSGSADEPSVCDQRLKLDSNDANDAARALDLCSFPAEGSRAWGVLRARFVNASGTGSIHDPHAVGLLTEFGAAKPRAGAALLALSTGAARAPGQPDYSDDCDAPGAGTCGLLDPDCDQKNASAPPAGYPKSSTGCNARFSTKALAYDQAALELTLRVPSNANGFSFESIFYTHEFPDYVCSTYNDFFVVFKQPKATAADDDNILFDKNHDPIGVNSSLFAVCDASAKTSKAFACEQGTALLTGTGYGASEQHCALSSTAQGGGATGWLKTTAPVEPGGTITLRFAIWDTGDSILDSTALLDHFLWNTFEGTPEKQVVTKTEPAPLL